MNFRQDIQALRGYAVLIIVLFHAGMGPKAGYLGVDIFFVISGFLITTLIVKHLNQGDFSFKEFYYRRAKRLLPAAYAVFFGTTAASYFFLNSIDFDDYRNQLLGALTFTANFALRDQVNYFDNAAEMKPLLHIWSLSIEEQFYMILPLALFFMPSKNWKILAALGTVISLALCLTFIQTRPDDVFYYLPTRAWELGIGSLCALYIDNKNFKKLSSYLFLPSIAALIIIPFAPVSSLHPWLDAIMVCLATCFVIAHQSLILNNHGSLKPLSKIGDYSYSLYLVHWPIFSLVANAYLGYEVPVSIRSFLLLLSCVLAFALYHTIEKPLHRKTIQNPKRFVGILLAIPVILFAMTFIPNPNENSARDYKTMRRANAGLSEDCDQTKTYAELSACETGPNPKIMVWGDSYAMHLVEGVRSSAKDNMVQATRSSCGPFLSMSYYALPGKTKEWAKSCIEFNDSIYKKIQNSPSLDIVVLGSTFGNVIGKKPGLKKIGHEEYQEISLGEDAGIDGLKKTINAIRDMGKKVIVISPPPKAGYNIGDCLERQENGKIVFGLPGNCTITLKTAHGLSDEVESFLARVQKELDVNVLYLSDFYECKDKSCSSTMNGKWLYRDSGHLSYEGSRELFSQKPILEQIYEKAR